MFVDRGTGVRHALGLIRFSRARNRFVGSRPLIALGVAAVGLALSAPVAVAAPAAPANVPDVAPNAVTASAWARLAHKPVVDGSRTTPTAQTTANPDGSWTLSEYAHPLRPNRSGTATSASPDSWCTTCSIQAHDVVQSGDPDAAHYNDTTGTFGDLKAGFKDDDSGISRSYLQLNTHDLAGAMVSSAVLRTQVVSSVSCNPTDGDATDLFLSGPISATTTWNTQPDVGNWQGSTNVANCQPGAPAAPATLDATDAAQQAAAGAWDSVTLQLRAHDETGPNAWREFGLNPMLQVTYDLPPNAPANLLLQSTLPCVQGDARPWVATNQPLLSGSVSDPDSTMLHVNFRVGFGTPGSETYANDLGTNLLTIGTPGPNQSSTAQFNVPTGWINDDGVYNWSMQVSDGILSSDWTGGCEFEVDTKAPLSPSVSMIGTPPARKGDPATFTATVGMATAGLADIDHFIYTTDGSTPSAQGSPQAAAVTSTDSTGNVIATATFTTTVQYAFTNYIRVEAVNKAGATGPIATCVTGNNLDGPSCSYRVTF